MRRANLADRVLLAYLTGLAALIVIQRDRVSGWPSFLGLHVLLIALILVLATGSRRLRTAHAWYPLIMPIILFEEAAALNTLLVDVWQDRSILAFEAWLFSEPPTAWLARYASPVLTELMAIGYFSYFLMLIVVGGVLHRRRDKGPFFGVMAASVLSYVVCYVVFIAFPTEGPARTLSHLPATPLSGGPVWWLVRMIQANAGVHGNAFPSAHAAGAVAALAFAWRYARTLALWLTPFVVLMCAGAVYLKYHYVSDIVAGVVIGILVGLGMLRRVSRYPQANETK